MENRRTARAQTRRLSVVLVLGVHGHLQTCLLPQRRRMQQIWENRVRERMACTPQHEHRGAGPVQHGPSDHFSWQSAAFCLRLPCLNRSGEMVFRAPVLLNVCFTHRKTGRSERWGRLWANRPFNNPHQTLSALVPPGRFKAGITAVTAEGSS